jgi:hypothetical protein
VADVLSHPGNQDGFANPTIEYGHDSQQDPDTERSQEDRWPDRRTPRRPNRIHGGGHSPLMHHYCAEQAWNRPRGPVPAAP